MIIASINWVNICEACIRTTPTNVKGLSSSGSHLGSLLQEGQGRRNRCGWCGQNLTNILAKTQPSRVSACSEARTLCNHDGKEKMTYVVEYVCMSSGWPHQSLSASDAPERSETLRSKCVIYNVDLLVSTRLEDQLDQQPARAAGIKEQAASG